MPKLWIVHRTPRERSALARLAAVPEAVLGAPGDRVFETAAAPDVVLMGVGADLEPELNFAHVQRRRAPTARWILIGPRQSEQTALSLFDTVLAEYLAYPPEASRLRGRIAHQAPAATPPALSERAQRDQIAGRFSRWFADLDLSGLLRALDPALADVPVRITGERGTGRGVLTRYLHFFGGAARGALVHIPCDADTRAAEIAAALAAHAQSRPRLPAVTLWLEDFDRLAPAEGRQIAGWIESGAPPGGVHTPLSRWIGTGALADPLESLACALAGIAIQVPPLRDRPEQIARVVDATARAWCAARGVRHRRFGEDAIAVLEEYPWPGNLSELEGVVIETLAAGAADPIRADDLVQAGEPFALLSATSVGTLLDDDDAVSAPAVDADSDAEDVLEALGASLAEDRERAPESRPAPRTQPGADALARLIGALSHEVRNPLTTIRTFAELLPQRFQDPEFRERFAETVRDDVGRIDTLVERLSDVSALGPPRSDKVDVTALLESLLAGRRDAIRARSLLVLKELEASTPHAIGDREQLRVAFDALLGKCLEWVPERGDVYIASRHHGSGPKGRPSMRVLLRFHTPGSSANGPGVSPADTSLDLLIAEIVIRSQGGDFAVAATDGEETLIVVDLPAPA
jgi:DNA-binding NtrC family response regulator